MKKMSAMARSGNGQPARASAPSAVPVKLNDAYFFRRTNVIRLPHAMHARSTNKRLVLCLITLRLSNNACMVCALHAFPRFFYG
jgi:hypothetical protein